MGFVIRGEGLTLGLAADALHLLRDVHVARNPFTAPTQQSCLHAVVIFVGDGTALSVSFHLNMGAVVLVLIRIRF